MNTSKNYKRLSPEIKMELLSRSLRGESVSKICKEYGISRTIFYHWLKEYKHTRKNNPADALSEKYPKGKSHWRKLDRKKEREIINLWLNNPDFSIRKVAKRAHVSVGGAWNVLKDYKERTASAGIKSLKRKVKKSYEFFSGAQKIELISRHEKGESITKLTREVGVSRTIFYRWISQYQHSKRKEVALESNRPKGDKHWRFVPELKNTVLEIVAQNPQFSLAQITIIVRSKGQTISRSGLYYMLKRMELNSYEARLAYSLSVGPVISRRRQFANARQFAVLCTIILFGLFSILFVINNPSKLPLPNLTNINTNQQPPQKQDGKKTAAGKPNSSLDRTEPQQSGTQQDFKWGALAMNSPRSPNNVGSDVSLGFGIIDHAGNTICNADISLEIFNPAGVRTGVLSSENGRVRRSGECSIRSVTNMPDYIADALSFEKAGVYKLHVKAVTYDGEKQFDEKLIVADNSVFGVERSSYPTRVYPLSTYPVAITINANRDFKGQIMENLPKGITASMISDRGIVFRNYKHNNQIIKWNVDLKKGDTYKLSYNLHFPQVWPEFYEIGPLKFSDSKTGKIVFQEARYWQVVADAVE